MERGQDPVVASVEERIARWTLLPVGNGEGLQVLNYQPGQEYQVRRVDLLGLERSTSTSLPYPEGPSVVLLAWPTTGGTCARQGTVSGSGGRTRGGL